MLTELDIQPGELWVHGAPVGGLKTHLSLAVAREALDTNHDVLLFTDCSADMVEKLSGLRSGHPWGPDSSSGRLFHLMGADGGGSLTAPGLPPMPRSDVGRMVIYDGIDTRGGIVPWEGLRAAALSQNLKLLVTVQSALLSPSDVTPGARRFADMVTVLDAIGHGRPEHDVRVLKHRQRSNPDGFSVSFRALDGRFLAHPEPPTPIKRLNRYELLVD